MANVRVTKKEKFEMIRGILEGVEVDNKDMLVEFIDKEVENLSKKRTALTKTQKENEVIIERVYDALVEVGDKVTVTDLMNAKDIEGITSNQKLSAMLKKLVDAGRVNKVAEGKKTYFVVANND